MKREQTHSWTDATSGCRRDAGDTNGQVGATLAMHYACDRAMPVLALRFLGSAADLLGDALEDLAPLALNAPELFLDRLDRADQETDGLAKDDGDRSGVAGEEPDGGGGDVREEGRAMVCDRNALDGATGYYEQAEEPQEHFPSGAAQDA